MRRNRLGKSGIVVSDICMGTMTFGTGADERLPLRFWTWPTTPASISMTPLKCTQYHPTNPMPAEPKKYLVAG